MMFRLLFTDKGATGLVLSEAEEGRLQLLNAALGSPTNPPILPKSYTSRKVKGEARG